MDVASIQNTKAGLASEFVVGAFPGPPNGEINLERYREIAEAGIDIIVPYWGTMDGVTNPDMLDLAHAAGLRVLAMDRRMGQMTMSLDVEYEPSIVRDVVADYKDHPALFAYGVRDEPPSEFLPRVAKICNLIKRLDPHHPPQLDLFPGYSTPKQHGAASYPEYVRGCIEATDPAALMYDHYPLRVNREADSGWHKDLALFREESRRVGIPLWVFVQCQGIPGYLRVPTRSEIVWQATTCLAYGVRGVWWYRYWTPLSPDETDLPTPLPGSMIDRHGKRAPSYDHVSDANRFLRIAGPALIGWDNRYVARFQDGLALEDGECPAVALSGQNFDLVVGTFVRGGARRVVVANDNYEAEATFSLTPAPGMKAPKLLASIDATVPSDTTATWKLGPGAAVLIELAP